MMRVFGTKQVEPTDEDRVAIARLSAVAARFKADLASDFTEAAPDPLGAPERSEAPQRSSGRTARKTRAPRK
jgi:hypothetical protein